MKFLVVDSKLKLALKMKTKTSQKHKLELNPMVPMNPLFILLLGTLFFSNSSMSSLLISPIWSANTNLLRVT